MDGDQNSQSKSNTPVTDDAVELDGIKISDSDFIIGVNPELTPIIDLALNYYEVIDNNQYIGVFSYNVNDTDYVTETLDNIIIKNEISAEIEIITGVNKEKLVEYIDREIINDIFSDNFTGEIEYLVIIIGR